MKKHKILKISVSLIIAILLLFMAAGAYFFNVAVVSGHKSFVRNHVSLSKKDPLYRQKKWYQREGKQHWYMESAGGNLRLDANYLPAAHSHKTVIVLHGFMNNKNGMGEYACLFHSLGYNVLLPDARAQGQSQGRLIGYGWPEREDVRKWSELVLRKTSTHKIALFGVSMGGATAMMTTGLKLPVQVKAVIEDCGYTNAKSEIEHEAQALYHMPVFPRFPLVEILSFYNRLSVGNFLSQASSVNSLARNKLPVLFIHGSKDNFVPTRMVYQNYDADHGSKQIWLAKGAGHAQSFAAHPHAYKEHVKKFLSKHL